MPPGRRLLQTPARRCSTATSPRGRSSCRSPAGRCRCSTRASARSTSPCATHAGVFDVSHMGEIETRGPQALAFLQRLLSNDVDEARGRRRAVQRAVPRGRRRARRPLHLPPRGRPLPDGHERRPTTRRTSRGCARTRTASTSRSSTASTTTRCSPSRARAARELARRRSPTGRCPRASARAELPRRRRAGARVRHRLHGRGRRRDPLRARRRAAPSGTRSSPPAPRRPGSAARDTLRLEVCFHLYGNDLMEERGPIEAGLGWCCKEDDGLHRRRGRRAPCARPAPPRGSCRSR